MNRRTFLVGTSLAGLGTASAQGHAARILNGAWMPAGLAVPSADQVAWQDLEIGMFVHFAPNTWQNVESDDLSTPLSEIDPKELDTDQWARTAVALGAKYLVFVAKHQGGFCMWQTHTTDYGIRNTPWKGGKGDVLREVAESCRQHGLKLGVYVCPRDDHFGAKTGGICATPELQAKYDVLYRQQLTEVLGNYGPMVEVWFDGSTRTPVADLLARYQPHAMIFQGPSATIRWVGNENGYAPYPCWNGIDRADAKTGTATSLNSDPDGDFWMPNEVDVSIRRPDWFWHTDNEDKVLTSDQLLEIYYRSVGRGAQLLLNIPANRQGLLPERDSATAVVLGARIKALFGKPVATMAGRGTTLTLPVPGGHNVDTVILQEDTRGGERVRGYVLEGRSGETWTSLGEGSAIGHKRIQPVTRGAYDAVRLRVTQSAAPPMLRTLAVFDTGVAPPENWNAPTQVWAADLVGEWKNGHFHLDLTKQVKLAGQYRLRFKPLTGKVTGLGQVVLKLHDTPQPALLKRYATHPNELVLDMTEVGSTVTVEGTVEGAPEGEITLQKL